MIISIGAGDIFDKIQYPFLIKNSQKKIGIEESILNLTKSIYRKPIANIILNGERPNAFSLILGTGQECPLHSCLKVLEVLAGKIGQKQKFENNRT